MTPEIFGQEYEVNCYYFDFTCQDCGQQGTARFESKDVEIDDFPFPKKTIYCCECKSINITIDDVGDY